MGGALKSIPGLIDRFACNIDGTDKQIDQLVYELYGLTEEEIKIVESQSSYR